MHSDRELLDWLNEQVIDMIYLDDGRVIDPHGKDVRIAIEQKMTEAYREQRGGEK